MKETTEKTLSDSRVKYLKNHIQDSKVHSTEKVPFCVKFSKDDGYFVILFDRLLGGCDMTHPHSGVGHFQIKQGGYRVF